MRCGMESELKIDVEGRQKRKRKPVKRFSFSSDDSSDDDASKNVSRFKIPKLSDTELSELVASSDDSSSKREESSHDLPSTSTQAPLTRVSSPFSNLSQHSHQELDVINIAKILVEIERRLDSIENNQKEILKKLGPKNSTQFVELPSGIELPCDSVEEINKLDETLSSEESVKALIVYLSVLGGKKTADTVRRILERLFTNQVAVSCNWTGKNKKHALKDLRITKLIPEIVRKNRNTATATDHDVYSVMANWFRFSKDRDGGRLQRSKDS